MPTSNMFSKKCSRILLLVPHSGPFRVTETAIAAAVAVASTYLLITKERPASYNNEGRCCLRGCCGGARLRFGFCGAYGIVDLCHSLRAAGPLERCLKSSRSWVADVGRVDRLTGETTLSARSLAWQAHWQQQRPAPSS